MLFKELRDREYNLRRELSYSTGQLMMLASYSNHPCAVLRNLARTGLPGFTVRTTDRLGYGFKQRRIREDDDIFSLFALDRMGRTIEAMRLAITSTEALSSRPIH